MVDNLKGDIQASKVQLAKIVLEIDKLRNTKFSTLAEQQTLTDQVKALEAEVDKIGAGIKTSERYINILNGAPMTSRELQMMTVENFLKASAGR